ncbi:MAG: hypothetical protein AAF291_10645 [Pseudomonadota bacterium]
MANRKPTAKERYEEIMRNAGAKKRALRDAAFERERAFRLAQQARQKRDASQGLKRSAAMIAVVTKELEALVQSLGEETDPDERIGLKAEIAHLKRILARIRDTGWRPQRKPPEAGLPVPAVPPNGPCPKQGGAAAALSSDYQQQVFVRGPDH